MYQWVEKRYWFFLVSAIVVFVGLVSIPFPPALRLGIDFTSGATLDITFAAPVSTSDLRQQMNELGFPEAIIQGTGEQRYFIRTRVLKEDVKDGSGNITKRSEKESIKDALAKRFGGIRTFEFASVSPRVSQETVRAAIVAVIAASVGIALYIAYAFRRVPHPFRWSVSAIIALVHDVFATVALFAVASKLLNIEINAMFITAMLTIMGYSINDTVVIFDRIREIFLMS